MEENKDCEIEEPEAESKIDEEPKASMQNESKPNSRFWKTIAVLALVTLIALTVVVGVGTYVLSEQIDSIYIPSDIDVNIEQSSWGDRLQVDVIGTIESYTPRYRK